MLPFFRSKSCIGPYFRQQVSRVAMILQKHAFSIILQKSLISQKFLPPRAIFYLSKYSKIYSIFGHLWKVLAKVIGIMFLWPQRVVEISVWSMIFVTQSQTQLFVKKIIPKSFLFMIFYYTTYHGIEIWHLIFSSFSAKWCHFFDQNHVLSHIFGNRCRGWL